MPVKKRIEVLKYTVTTTPAPYQEAKGNWVYPEPVTVEMELSCRSEANTAGRPLPMEDGTFIQYAFTVFLDQNAPEVFSETPVEIFKGEKKVGSGTVKRFHRWQRYAQVWV